MVFTKTSNPWWFIDDTPANVVAQLKLEQITKNQVISIAASTTAGQIVCIVYRGGSN